MAESDSSRKRWGRLRRMINVLLTGGIALVFLSLYSNSLAVSRRVLDTTSADVSDVALMAAVTGQMKDYENEISSLQSRFTKFEKDLEQVSNATQISLLQSRLAEVGQELEHLSKANEQPQLQEISLEPIDICFASSVFGRTSKTADRPHDVRKFQMGTNTSFQFFLYTNLEDLDSPGWTKVLRNFTIYRRFITQSRWGKFMAWKDPEMKACETIFYFDGHYKPKSNRTSSFLDMENAIRKSDVGLSQVQHPARKRTALQEFEAIKVKKKDIPKNIKASVKWLQAQPDFFNNCTLYANYYFDTSLFAVPTFWSFPAASRAAGRLLCVSLHVLTFFFFYGCSRLRSHQ
jgi:hypothetical protein